MMMRHNLLRFVLASLVIHFFQTTPTAFCETKATKTVTRSQLGSVAIDEHSANVTFEDLADDGQSYRVEISISKPRESQPIKASRIDAWMLARGGRALPAHNCFSVDGQIRDFLIEGGSRGATANAIFSFDHDVTLDELTAVVVAVDGNPTVFRLAASKVPAPAPAVVTNLAIGKWTVNFTNGVHQACEINGDGTASVVEPARKSGGQVEQSDNFSIIRYHDDRLERWTRVGKRMVVEHWFPTSSFRTGSAVLGIADRTPVEPPLADLPISVRGRFVAEEIKDGVKLPLELTIHNGFMAEISFASYGVEPNSWNGETARIRMVDIYRDNCFVNLVRSPPQIEPPAAVAGMSTFPIESGQALTIRTDASKWEIDGGWEPGKYRLFMRVEGLSFPGGRCLMNVMSAPIEFNVSKSVIKLPASERELESLRNGLR